MGMEGMSPRSPTRHDSSRPSHSGILTDYSLLTRREERGKSLGLSRIGASTTLSEGQRNPVLRVSSVRLPNPLDQILFQGVRVRNTKFHPHNGLHPPTHRSRREKSSFLLLGLRAGRSGGILSVCWHPLIIHGFPPTTQRGFIPIASGIRPSCCKMNPPLLGLP